MRATRALTTAVLLWVLASAAVPAGEDGESTGEFPPGSTATPVSFISVAGLDAELQRQRGHVVVLNLWATWCVSCLREIPELLRLERELRAEGVVLLGISMDEPRDLDNLVRPYHAKYFPAFRTFLRRDTEMDAVVSVVDPAWNEVLPTTYIIDAEGKVRKRFQGKQLPEQLRVSILRAQAVGAAAGER